MPFLFENLLVYQKALDFADEVCHLTSRFDRGSLQECVPLLELASRRGQLSDAVHTQLKARLEEISRMLSGLISGIENRTR